ncbi:AIPR family protein [Nonomuraea sp. NPDC001831]|uniref:AIPR family protein n=1 Tax=Nonomuraea sp. NPDC001831 TaxID=3364340 RepID=UPI00367D56F1
MAILDGAPRIWLIQSKWSDQAKASADMNAALKLVDGFKAISHREYDWLNDRYRPLADRINEILNHPRAHVTLLPVLMGPTRLNEHVEKVFKDAKRDFNVPDPNLPLGYTVLGEMEALQIIQRDFVEQITLSMPMEKWHHIADPYEAFHGMVSAGEIGQWYAEHGGRLFAKNVRQSLGLTPVNSQIISTLVERPEVFWYFNNGITILCDEVASVPLSRGAPNGPRTLTLTNASVVNGAQTVSACYEAMTRYPDAGLGAQVAVKIISTLGGFEDFGTSITKAANTQNNFEPRDYAALDPTQARIRDDFLLTIEKTYAFQRSELDPPPESGCSMVEAGMALLCAHRDPALAVWARADQDEVWRPDGKIYPRLFGRPPAAESIWRSVQLHRVVREALHETRKSRRGRGASVAEHGDLLVAHIIFQHVGLGHMEDESDEWSDVLHEVPRLIEDVVDRLIFHIDDLFTETSYIRSTFANVERGKQLVKLTLDGLASGTPTPAVKIDYTSAKKPQPPKPKAVSTLVQAGRIAEGTTLSFAVIGEAEEQAMRGWLNADPKRSLATWVNHRSKPLLWAADGRRYSPTGLVQHMWKLAGWESAPVTVRGTARWSVPEAGSLVWLAEQILAAAKSEDGEEE